MTGNKFYPGAQVQTDFFCTSCPTSVDSI